ncbi:zinc-dependent metalloprotease [Shewanella sp. JM162201]|uniref:Zinc-dependent metalloprotease n=1 Tax=Shewanella jiangmenensis TaxID=2837387 RepID=A0ABS5V2M8_9GAMM|nr:zinc-dependent metalloprotease [Shewanella jiangmenensis]MBT1444185.1 zinc-dependent metalloprotease [Shewanella jiangmenensis]
MKPSPLALALMLVFLPVPALMAADATGVRQSKSEQGFLTLQYDNKGEVYVEANRLNKPFLLVTSLPQGVGSNDIGLDRGQLGRTRMVQFERIGPDLILRELNTRYRADTDYAPEQRAVKEAFADSILWRAPLDGKGARAPLSGLVINDLHGVADALKATGQGSYQLDASRSMILPEYVKSFPKNSDIDVQLTFASGEAGARVAEVTPDPKAVSIRMRYSFIALPEQGYSPRDYHPQSGYLSDQYTDFATAIDESVVKRHLLRHRLVKKNPGPAPSEVVEPIVYYLDPGVPEPIRSALLDGGRWWTEAFNAAGFINGFKMELLPEDADPQDVRYNVVQWVHRASRGWSYGSFIADPRSGEIIKGHVTLGSLRVRQDHLIARGLTAGWEDRDAAAKAASHLALERIRQLSAHEIGHTLGLDHNFAASGNNNASVMDYPHPLITIKESKIDISTPYSPGVGEWDKFAIAYGYGDFGSNEAAALKKLLTEVQTKGLRYIGENDSRSADASHAYASLWDNGPDPVAELARLQLVRRQALNDFNPALMRDGEPLGELADALVPIYLLTRYQIEAAAKLIGGTDYAYDGAYSWNYIAPDLQKQALGTLLTTLDTAELALPQGLSESLLPKAGNYSATRESFASSLGVVTDPVGMAEVLSRHTVSALLAPKRLNRVEQGFQNDGEQLSVTAIVDKLFAVTLFQEGKAGVERGIWMRVNAVAIDGLLEAFHSKDSSPEVKAVLGARLAYARTQLERKSARSSEADAAHFNFLTRGITRGLDDANQRIISAPLPMPPGSPI